MKLDFPVFVITNSQVSGNFRLNSVVTKQINCYLGYRVHLNDDNVDFSSYLLLQPYAYDKMYQQWRNVCVTFSGERCDVAIDDSFAYDDDTGDVIDTDDNFEQNGREH